jgi:DNA-binding NarL/FixJ family response regulator
MDNYRTPGGTKTNSGGTAIRTAESTIEPNAAGTVNTMTDSWKGVSDAAESSTRTMRILIVDDHPIVRQGLALLIANEPDLEVCGEAADAAEAIQLLTTARPDLIVVDISLHSGNGIELIKQIKARDEHARMLVSSMHDEALFAERALRAGAMGYVNKAEATEKVLEAIRQVLRGKIYLSPRMTERMLCRAVGSEENLESSPIDTLSDRELEVFELIGQGLTTRQIANKLHLSPKTVETYRENIKSKLNLTNATELTRHAVQWTLENH